MNVRRFALLSVSTALAAATALVGAAPASAGIAATLLPGVVTCDAATGQQVITWTFTNNTGANVTFVSGTADASLLTTGSLASPTVTMLPSPVAAGATATGEARASGNASGTVSLTIVWNQQGVGFPFTMIAPAVLSGGCVQTTTTTTTIAPTTTAAATTTIDNQSGATLPATGNDESMVPMAVALVLVGATTILATRRRRATR